MKREHQAVQLKKNQQGEKKVHEKFTENQVFLAWEKYIKHLKRKGRKILPSILATDQPKVEGTQLSIKLPNETMKEGVEKEKMALMSFLKRELRNTDITLHIKVDAEVAKRKAFTPLEKYQKLKEKNPLVDKLKDTFGLDI